MKQIPVDRWLCTPPVGSDQARSTMRLLSLFGMLVETCPYLAMGLTPETRLPQPYDTAYLFHRFEVKYIQDDDPVLPYTLQAPLILVPLTLVRIRVNLDEWYAGDYEFQAGYSSPDESGYRDGLLVITPLQRSHPL